MTSVPHGSQVALVGHPSRFSPTQTSKAWWLRIALSGVSGGLTATAGGVTGGLTGTAGVAGVAGVTIEGAGPGTERASEGVVGAGVGVGGRLGTSHTPIAPTRRINTAALATSNRL